MANTINLKLDTNVIPINFGAFTLDFHSTDTKDLELQAKAEELKVKAESIDDSTEKAAREGLKTLLDDFFKTMFDYTAPEKIYKACGQNTMGYLTTFLQLLTALQEIQEKKRNDETFKKYLAE